MKGSHVAAFLIGAIAGGVAALLYAPQSGKKTRKQIREYVGEEMEQAGVRGAYYGQSERCREPRCKAGQARRIAGPRVREQ